MREKRVAPLLGFLKLTQLSSYTWEHSTGKTHIPSGGYPGAVGMQVLSLVQTSCQSVKERLRHSIQNLMPFCLLYYSILDTHTHTHTSKWQHTNFQQNKRDRHTFLNINVLVLTYSLHDFQVNNLHKLSFIHKIFHRLAFAHKDEN